MKSKKLLKYCILFSAIFVLTIFTVIGCSKENSSAKATDNQAQQTAEKKDGSSLSIIRDSTVNVLSLDADKDGYLYQCEMDYNVISDKPGTCPKCGMTLKKVTVTEAKKNSDAFYGKE
jgi:hypothetical protein